MPPPKDTHNHPPLPTTAHSHPPPSTVIRRHQPPPRNRQVISTTSHQRPKYIHYHLPQSKIYPSKKVFYKKNIKMFYSEVNTKNIFINYNLGQKFGDKFTKLCKIGFYMEGFTADFLQFFTKIHQNLVFERTAGYSILNPSISSILLKFPNSLRF